jgi:hypothetical protein
MLFILCMTGFATGCATDDNGSVPEKDVSMGTEEDAGMNENTSGGEAGSPDAAGGQLRGQDVTDITALAPPDEVVYMCDGAQIAFSKGTPEYRRIMDLNNARQTEKADKTEGALQLLVDFEHGATQTGDFLIYQYENTTFVPVYFSLREPGHNFVINYYFANSPPSYIVSRAERNAYGSNIGSSDELLAYLREQSI